MNFSDTYHRMNAPLVPSDSLIEKTLAKTRRRMFPLRRLAIIAAVMATLLITPTLAVRTEMGYQMLYRLAPATAQFFQPVRLSAEDNGVTMEVVSVQVDGSRAQAYISLTGDSVDGTCDLFDSYSFHLPFDQSGHCERVGYDEDTHTALFLCTTETLDGSAIPAGSKMTFSVGCFLSGKKTLENAAIALDLADFVGEAEVMENPAYFSTGGGYSDETGKALMEQALMLKPGKTLVEPLPGLTITAAGYADGLFHVQLCCGDTSKLDNHGWLYLKDEKGNQVTDVYSAGFVCFGEEESRVDYTQFAFDITPKALAGCTLRGGLLVAAASLTEGNWQVTFPLDNTRIVR